MFALTELLQYPKFLEPSASNSEINIEIPLFNLALDAPSPSQSSDAGVLRITTPKPGFLSVPSLAQVVAARQARARTHSDAPQIEVDVDMELDIELPTGSGSSQALDPGRKTVRFGDD